ncbi:MAG: GTPase ObgE [Candidatus Geothermincolia bacterium]
MFIDEAKLFVKGGSGGAGSISWHREKFAPMGGPDGGSGGRGGSIILEASRDVNTLVQFSYKPHYKASKGRNGAGNNRNGAEADDIFIKVPIGTQVKDEEDNLLADLATEGERYVAARGGRGGRGNAAFASGAMRAPAFAEKGEPGQERELHLELKLLADVALVGLPNAGKSSLIARVSAARPKIADYPFTTLQPNLGVVRMDDETSFVIADVPGLVEDAHLGKGLGIQFLRHAERSRALVHIVDLSGQMGDPKEQFTRIENELASYGEELRAKPTLVAGNKIDITDAETVEDAREWFREQDYEFFPISAVTGEGVRLLMLRLQELLAELVETRPEPEDEKMHFVYEPPEPDFVVTKKKKRFIVSGTKVERIIVMTDLENPQAVLHLQRRLRGMGVDDELRRAGAKPGDEVIIGEHSFDFEEG